MRLRPAVALATLVIFLSPVFGADGAADPASPLDKGLAFLAARQSKDGSLPADPSKPEATGHVGITALALEAFASAPAPLAARYRASADAAAGFIASQQQPDGAIYVKAFGDATYNTAIAVSALARLDAAKYAKQIGAARDFLVGAQFGADGKVDDKSPDFGGWGYGHDGKPHTDLSNASFALEALKDAGLPPDSDAFKRAAVFIARCQNRAESNDAATFEVGNDGGFTYDVGHDEDKSPVTVGKDGKKAFASYASMTYAGLKSFLYANVSRDDPRVKAAVGWIQAHYTLDENYGLGTRPGAPENKQGIYYYYLAFAKALEGWGDAEIVTADGVHRLWRAELAAKLAAVQKADGSWVNEANPRWWEANPILATCYATNALAIALRGSTAAPGAEHGAAPAPKDDHAGDADTIVCPVSGDVVRRSRAVTYVHNGKTYLFCCKDCIKYFKKDPAKYGAK